MRFCTDHVVTVTRGSDGKFSSPQATYKDSWSSPHFPEILVFETRTPGGLTCWFGVAMYRDPDIPRKLAMPGCYTALIPGMERQAMLALPRGESQGFCITLAKADALKGLQWELMLSADSPYAETSQGAVEKYEAWVALWRQNLAQTEADLSQKDAVWSKYNKRSRGARDAEGDTGGAHVPAEGVERQGLEPEPVHGPPQQGPRRRR